MSTAPKFAFATCQHGAERVLKAEVAKSQPGWTPAFSRPGFVTFKLPDDHKVGAPIELRSLFARVSGYCLGKTKAETPQLRAEESWRFVAEAGLEDQLKSLHVWSRQWRPEEDDSLVGPPVSEPTVIEARSHLLSASPVESFNKNNSRPPEENRSAAPPARADQPVLDCLLVEPGEWWLGWHRASSVSSRWPGGVFPIPAPDNMVSRAFLKMEEALRWSRLPLTRGDVCAELGAAPGGASQALLERGMIVCGIDPADIAPIVLEHPNFNHWQMRGAEVQRRFFRPIQWLMSDMSVTPSYTLECVESIVNHPTVNIRGMILTLKLTDWKLAAQIPACLEQIRSWGFRDVRAKQLAHNRQEICVAALRRAALRRMRPGKKKPRRRK